MLCDAHVHLASDALSNELSKVIETYDKIGLSKAIVIGTCPDDWAQVVELAEKDERFIPAIGLHPWKVSEAPKKWQEQFLSYLDTGVGIIGEIGLDQWIEDYDIEQQTEAFRWQLSLATERNLPTSIHCLKAHEPMMKTLREVDLPERGFKLHAYNGPVDTIKPLLEMGAYFSFNAGQLKPNAKHAPELIKLVPEDRFLIETDAPDFLPPTELREFNFPTSATAFDKLRPEQGSRPPLCHPGNIREAYRAIAELRQQSYQELAKKIALNFERYFLN